MLLKSSLIPPSHTPKSVLPDQANPPPKPLAKVEEAILPGEDGQVYFNGTYWSARFYDPDCQVTAAPGDKVRVVVGDRLPLLVMPI